MKKKRKIIAGIAIAIMVFIIAAWLFFANGTKDKMVIRVEGFDVEYTESDRKLTVENFESIELGNSLEEIESKLGEPDIWIGSGILRPVYFLEDMKVVVFHFKYPAVCEDLEQIVMISENGESQVIKDKQAVSKEKSEKWYSSNNIVNYDESIYAFDVPEKNISREIVLSDYSELFPSRY